MQRILLGLALSSVALAAGTTIASDGDLELDSKNLTFVQGDDVWVPGWVFNDAQDWLALNCTERTCQLVAAELRVTPASWQGHYDGVPTSGQRLGFQTSSDVQGEVVAWIRQNTRLPWLGPGAVEFYYAHEVTPIVQDKKDTYELVIASQGETVENLAPVLRPSAGPVDQHSQIYLRLRARGKQQLLSEQMVACFGELHLDYLLWSGDLDQDGKTDYLIDYTDSVTGTVKFYLSSYAEDGQLVGIAGVGITHPLDGECA